jgi:hypothetical protein
MEGVQDTEAVRTSLCSSCGCEPGEGFEGLWEVSAGRLGPSKERS